MSNFVYSASGHILFKSEDCKRTEDQVGKIAALEAALEKHKQDIRFYTPSTPILGLNFGGIASNDSNAVHFGEDEGSQKQILQIEETEELGDEDERGDDLDVLDDSTDTQVRNTV